jgi:hypothetical protein
VEREPTVARWSWPSTTPSTPLAAPAPRAETVLARPVLPERAGAAIGAARTALPTSSPSVAAPSAVPATVTPAPAASSAPPAVPTSSSGAAVAAGGAAGAQRTASAAATAALSDRELEELARRLTRPLLRRLRQEVLLDRERVGLRTDRGWER